MVMASDDLAVALHLAVSLERPILLEGAAGVETEVARVLSAVQTELIRLQCYEGLDASQAIYEWNYQRQLLAIRSSAEAGETGSQIEKRLFSEEFLLERPLLAAIRHHKPPVLLIDEIDRADEEFEAYLLEILADFQITIPELGTLKALSKPMVVLTANGTRDLSDALRRDACTPMSITPIGAPNWLFYRHAVQISKQIWPKSSALFRNCAEKIWKKSPVSQKHWILRPL